MTSIVDVKAKLSDYIDRAARGERIVICRHNRPIAELRAVEAARTEPRPVGPLPGRPRFDVPASFFEPMTADELAQWEGVTAVDPLSAQWVAPSARGALTVAEKGRPYGPARRQRASKARTRSNVRTRTKA